MIRQLPNICSLNNKSKEDSCTVPLVLFLMSCARLFETWPIKFELLNNKNSLYSFYKGEKCGVWSQELFRFLKAGPEASNQQGFVNSGTFIKFSMPWRSFHIIVSTTSFRLQHYSIRVLCIVMHIFCNGKLSIYTLTCMGLPTSPILQFIWALYRVGQ